MTCYSGFWGTSAVRFFVRCGLAQCDFACTGGSTSGCTGCLSVQVAVTACYDGASGICACCLGRLGCTGRVFIRGVGWLTAISLASVRALVAALVAARVAALVGPVPEVPPRLAIAARRAKALLAWVAWVRFLFAVRVGLVCFFTDGFVCLNVW